jgi:hypothetical protein
MHANFAELVLNRVLSLIRGQILICDICENQRLILFAFLRVSVPP